MSLAEKVQFRLSELRKGAIVEMSMQIICPGCSKKLAVPETALGKQIKCPACSRVMSLAAKKASSSQPPATAPAQPQAAKTPASAAQLTLACPCGSKLKIPATARGKQVKCPKCQRTLKVPGATTNKPSRGRPVAAPAQPGAAAVPAAVPVAQAAVPTAEPVAVDPLGAGAVPANPLDAPMAATAADPFGAPAADPFAATPVGTTPVGSADPFGTPAGAGTGGVSWDNLPSAAASPGAFPAAQTPSPAAAFPAASAMPTPAAQPKAAAAAPATSPSKSGRDWSSFFSHRMHIGILVMLIGGPFVAFLGWQSKQKLARLNEIGITVDGVLLEGEERRGRKGSRSYTFTVMYSTEDKQVITEDFSVKKDFFYSHVSGDTVSDLPVKVRYNPEDPSEAIIVGGSKDDDIGLIFGIIMFVIGLAGTGYIVFVGDIDW